MNEHARIQKGNIFNYRIFKLEERIRIMNNKYMMNEYTNFEMK